LDDNILSCSIARQILLCLYVQGLVCPTSIENETCDETIHLICNFNPWLRYEESCTQYNAHAGHGVLILLSPPQCSVMLKNTHYSVLIGKDLVIYFISFNKCE